MTEHYGAANDADAANAADDADAADAANVADAAVKGMCVDDADDAKYWAHSTSGCRHKM